jgi:hypothetical protein
VSPPNRAARPRPRQPFGRQRVAGHHAPWAIASGQIGPDTVCGIKYSFFDLLNHINISKIPKFIETCKNVQKWQTKFCWTPHGQIYAVGLTKFTFVQYSIVQNYKNSNAKINVYKYLYLQIF